MPRLSLNNKGRAILARPLLLCAFLVLPALGFASSAQALSTPVLTTTNPISPGASLTPRIKGVVEESDTKVITFGSGLGPITAGEDPNNTVRIYTAADCTGPVAAQGTVATLKGEGILVSAPVAADSATLFYATQTDGLEVSACSNGLRYRQVASPPDVPVFTAVSPASPANENFPRLIGSADPDATISIYATGVCAGTPVATGSATEFSGDGIQVSVGDNTNSTFVAKATMAGFESDCSGPVLYSEVTPQQPPTDPNPGTGSGGSGGGVDPGTQVKPPQPPRLRTDPGGAANNNLPRVVGSAPAGTAVRVFASADCSGSVVAKGSAVELAAGFQVRVMDNASIVFSAVAVGGEAVSKCSDPVVYVEDSLTPRTRITMAPAAKTAKKKAVIRFADTTGNSPGTAFLCKVDKKQWKACSSPLRLRKLKPRKYTVRVKASDPAGNVEAKGAKRTFKVVPRP